MFWQINEHLVSELKDHQIFYILDPIKYCGKNYARMNWDKNNMYFNKWIFTFLIKYRWIILWSIEFSNQFVEKIKKRILFNEFFLKTATFFS